MLHPTYRKILLGIRDLSLTLRPWFSFWLFWLTKTVSSGEWVVTNVLGQPPCSALGYKWYSNNEENGCYSEKLVASYITQYPSPESHNQKRFTSSMKLVSRTIFPIFNLLLHSHLPLGLQSVSFPSMLLSKFCIHSSSSHSTQIPPTSHNFDNAPYLLTPWSRVLLEKLTSFVANQEVPRILWNPKVHYRT